MNELQDGINTDLNYVFWILHKKCIKSMVSAVITVTFVVKAPQNYYYSVKYMVSLVVIELLLYVSQ